MFKELIDAIQNAVRTEAIDLSNPREEYFTRAVHLPPKEPTVDALEVHTLTGLIDWLNGDVDSSEEAIALHVCHPHHVEAIGSAQGRHLQRNTWVTANCRDIIGDGFRFGYWHSVEQFIINVQAQFVQNEGRDRILALVGNLTEESIKTHSDDGVTQQVTARTGIARVANVDVPNPVVLAPYRTFPEIAQPESAFVFRLKQSEREGVQAALFEADGGAWKLDAIAGIRSWLSERASEITIIA